MPDEALTARFSVEPEHPALKGHFPDNPIVPAVLLLGFVADTLARAGKQLRGVNRMKFLRPVRPGEVIDITVHQPLSAQGAIEVAIDGELVAQGEWRS
jgi:3-hydroxymyristoyl/3-hydroxydecanoyl-(acyl carrier protein) dehydratase